MAFTGKAFRKAFPVLLGIEESIFFSSEPNGTLEFQATTRKELNRVRDIINKAAQLTEPWKKEYNDGCRWWEYTNETAYGLKLRIYADAEGPQSCTRVETIETVEENVPVTFEKRLVERKVVKWECPEE